MILLFAFTAALQLVNNTFSRIIVPTAMTTFFSPLAAASHATVLNGVVLSVALLLQPLAGIWADQLRSTRGATNDQRHHVEPWGGAGDRDTRPIAALPQTRLTVVGAAIVVVSLCGMGAAFPSHASVWMVAYAVMTVGAVLSITAYEAVKVALVPVTKRGAGGALQGVFETVGSTVGYILVTYALPIAQEGRVAANSGAAPSAPAFFYACGGLVAALMSASAVAVVRLLMPGSSIKAVVSRLFMPRGVLRRCRADGEAVQPLHTGNDLTQQPPGACHGQTCAGLSRFANAMCDRDLRMLALSRTAYAAGLAVTQLHFFFLLDVVGATSSEDASRWLTWSSFVDSGAVVVAAILAGTLSDAWGRKQFVYMSAALYVVAFVTLPWVPRGGVAVFLAGPTLLFGLAHGVQKAVDFAILVDVIDERPGSVGTYVGVGVTAGTLGSTAGSYTFGPLLDAFPETNSTSVSNATRVGHSRLGFVVTYSVVASSCVLLSAVAVWAIHDHRLTSKAMATTAAQSGPPRR